MTKALISALTLASLAAGCGGGAQVAGPVPTVPASSTQPAAATSTATESNATTASAPAPVLCSDRTVAIKVASQEGAAGTIRTLWRVKNTAQHSCRSFGYPGMDFHTSSGWLDIRVHRGGFADINQAPAPLVLRSGQALYFVSYWSDVTTNGGACKQFDRVKVTLPDNFVSARVVSSGCLNPRSVHVGPVTKTPTA
jgi:Protein of unknown function (DUF4232)